MHFSPTPIPDVVLIDPVVHTDNRGFLMETWAEQRFAEAGITARFVQDVHSRSVAGTLRGIHYQIERAQGKLVRVLAGTVFDVAVDLRRSSPSFGQWTGANLSGENRRQIWIPEGFGHGFVVLSETADIEYRMTELLLAGTRTDRILWDDPDRRHRLAPGRRVKPVAVGQQIWPARPFA